MLISSFYENREIYSHILPLLEIVAVIDFYPNVFGCLNNVDYFSGRKW